MELVEFSLGGAVRPSFRYDLLRRVRRCADARDVRFMGFALAARAALLLEGDPEAVVCTVQAVKAGTSRARGSGPLGSTRTYAVYDPLGALVALHRHPDGPLASPWTSHRDLMGFREADFFDRSVWAGRIDPRRVHVDAGGGPLPRGFPPPLERRVWPASAADVALCLRVSAAVLGVVPESRRALRLFSHLGRHAGYRQVDLADAVLLSTRRIRQLQREDEPLLAVAARSLRDRRLRRVP
ncbi:MAG: hypothetical protein H6737_03305 [Alphaproteobacteria bacterium]|nr:hypothetical protein [Alphaproteobacteria bacterium]